MGDSERKGLSYLADITDGKDLGQAYKEARTAVHHQADVEKAVVQSASVLFTKPADGEKKLEGLASLVDQRASALLKEVSTYYRLKADQLNVRATEPAMTAAEKEAAKMYVERVVGQGRGFGAYRQAMSRLTPEELAALRKVPQHMSAELNVLIGQKKSVLEIREFLSGEFEPLPLEDLIASLRAQEKLGSVKITSKP